MTVPGTKWLHLADYLIDHSLVSLSYKEVRVECGGTTT